ncbi:MAG: SPOR domain-containing protein [Pseudomonadales bacterium]|nr:SPOR domain-containing protein [Pseudomonadales bacterium]
MDYSSDQNSVEEKLQQALHLIHYGRSVLLVRGESSETKSTWLRALEHRCAEDQLRLCSIELSSTTNDLQLLSLIALGFGINYQRSDLRTLTDLLHNFQRDQQYAQKSVVFVRNAQLLDVSALIHIQRLSELDADLGAFQFVLIYSEGDMVIEPDWGSLPDIYEFQIDPQTNAGDSAAGTSQKKPSFQTQFNKAAVGARGNNLESGRFFSLFIDAMKSKNVFGFPRIHLIVISIVAVIVILALLGQRSTEQTLAPVQIELEVPKLGSGFVTLKDADPVAIKTPESAKESNLIPSEELVVRSTDKPVSVIAAAPVAKASPFGAKAPVAPASKAQHSESGPAKKRQPIPSEPIVQSPLSQRERYEKQLLELDPNSYTLQLFATYDQSSVKAFIGKYSDISQLRYYRGRHNNKPWYMVVAGVYLDSGSAAKGVKKLPSALKRQKPWPRKLESIQSSIRKYQAKR